MKLKVNLAGTKITISFTGSAEKAVPLCKRYLQSFLCQHRIDDAEIKVSVLDGKGYGFPVWSTTRDPVFEQILSTPEVAAWLKELPEYEQDFPISENTISSFCLNGLLFFNPDTASGRLYLLNPGAECFKPLYRLFWIYFAQVLGERGGCFIHGVALVKDQKGYLFMGESGAGKTTLAELCNGYTLFSDDSPIFYRRGVRYHVFPSPYRQLDLLRGPEEHIAGMSAEVREFYFLVKDNKFFFERISNKEAVSRIVNRYIHYFLYLSTQAKSSIFSTIYEACKRLPAYNFHFCLDRRRWRAVKGS